MRNKSHHFDRRHGMTHLYLNRSMAILAMTAATIFAAQAPAYANSLAQVEQAKTLRVAVDLNAPPYGMKDSNLHETGSDVETARLFAKDLGVKPERKSTRLNSSH